MRVSAVDVFPAAVQSSGQTPAAEMVHGSQRSWQEEDHKRRHANSAGPTAEVLQLPAVEGSEDRLQEVRGHLLIACASPFITMLSVTFQLWCCLPYNNLTRPLTQVNDQPSSPKALWCVYSLSACTFLGLCTLKYHNSALILLEHLHVELWPAEQLYLNPIHLVAFLFVCCPRLREPCTLWK